jgi:hypothetical protein
LPKEVMRMPDQSRHAVDLQPPLRMASSFCWHTSVPP